MIKMIFGFSLLIFQLSSFASEVTCLDKLLNYSRYSGSHQLLRDEWYDGKETLDAEGATSAMNFLVGSKLLCRPDEVIVKVQANCQFIHADIAQSNSCFIFTNLGYFIISRDNGKNVNFIFSKDKQYSEGK
ncbi:MAG: hypothetical protein AB7I27_05525 [Bacteriovoracaceae bacterium]